MKADLSEWETHRVRAAPSMVRFWLLCALAAVPCGVLAGVLWR